MTDDAADADSAAERSSAPADAAPDSAGADRTGGDGHADATSADGTSADGTSADTTSADAASANPDGAADSTAAGDTPTGEEPDARSVVVPDRVYKAVTVFSTLFAVVTVVGGFVVLDAATQRATLSLSEVNPVLALVGVGLIVAGAVTYAFSTRFRARGMGNAKDDTDEPSNNG